MKLFIFILISACLVQTAFLPVNLVLLILICRALIVTDRANLYGAFFGGLLLSFLSQVNLGFYPVCFLIIIQVLQLVKKSPLSSNLLTVVPISLAALLLISLLEKVLLSQSINIGLIIVESLLSLPLFIVMKIWEERFIVSPPLKLKF